MSEQSLEDRARKYARQYGAQLLKWTSPSHNGMPDRILLQSGGRCMFIEFKTDLRPARPSKLQLHRHMQLRQLGFRVEVIHSMEQFKQLFYTERGELKRVN